MDTILLIVHVVVAAALVGLVLLQQGKGADMGAAFGAGASQTVFGARGSGNFLTRTTAILAALFFITSMVLAYFAGQGARVTSVTDEVVPTEQVAPVAPSEPVAEDVPVVPSEGSPAPTLPE